MRWGVLRWCGGRWNPALQSSLRPHCCIFFPWHQTSGKFLNTSTFPDNPPPFCSFSTYIFWKFSNKAFSYAWPFSHTAVSENPPCSSFAILSMLDHSGQGKPAQAATPTAWEEKDPPCLQQDLSSHSVAPPFSESLEEGRAPTSFVCSLAIGATSLNPSLPGACCKATELLLSATCSLHLHCWFLRLLSLPCSKSLAILPAFFPWCGQMNTIDLPSPAPTVPWEPLSKWLSQAQPLPGAVALPLESHRWKAVPRTQCSDQWPPVLSFKACVAPLRWYYTRSILMMREALAEAVDIVQIQCPSLWKQFYTSLPSCCF